MEAHEMFDKTKRVIEQTDAIDPEMLKRDIEELQEVLTSKKLNTSIY